MRLHGVEGGRSPEAGEEAARAGGARGAGPGAGRDRRRPGGLPGSGRNGAAPGGRPRARRPEQAAQAAVSARMWGVRSLGGGGLPPDAGIVMGTGRAAWSRWD